MLGILKLIWKIDSWNDVLMWSVCEISRSQIRSTFFARYLCLMFIVIIMNSSSSRLELINARGWFCIIVEFPTLKQSIIAAALKAGPVLFWHSTFPLVNHKAYQCDQSGKRLSNESKSSRKFFLVKGRGISWSPILPGTYQPYYNETYTVVSTGTAAPEEEKDLASAKEVNMLQE